MCKNLAGVLLRQLDFPVGINFIGTTVISDWANPSLTSFAEWNLE